MMEDTISVIVPVYNVEKYLSTCLDSLLIQSYKKLEIILIDDGSTDKSGIICDQYAAKNSRFVVIHQKNAGAGAAKNAGLKIASGKFLAFVDSDDTLEADAYEYMMNAMSEYDADIVVCAFRNQYKSSVQDQVVAPSVCIENKFESLRRFTIDWTSGLLWNKLYKRILFDEVFFEEGHIIDDEYFTYQGFLNANLVVRTPKIVYNYRMRKSGVMNSPESYQRIFNDKIDYVTKRRDKVTSALPELKYVFDIHYIDMLLLLYNDRYATEDGIRLIKEKLRAYLKSATASKLPIKTRIDVLKRLTGIQKPGFKMSTNTDVNINEYFD